MRTGLSRVEVLVVAAVALLTVGLILPRVQAARGDADRLKCANNLRTLGTACAGYEQANGGLPPRRTGFNNGEPYGGWGTAVLSHLGDEKTARAYNPKLDYFDPGNKAATETQLTAFLCPATPAGRTVVIESQATAKAANPDKDTVFSVKAGVSDYIASNGVLLPRGGYALNFNEAGQMNGNQRQPMGDNGVTPLAKITDGTACTLLLIEQAGRPEVWRAGKKKDGDGQFGRSPNARGAWAGWGSIAFGPADATTGESPGVGDATDCTVNCNNWFGVYGFHTGGANVLMCDGSVRFVTPKLDPLTFAYLTLRDDGHAIDPTDY